MTAADISSTMTVKGVSPNLQMKVDVVSVTCTENDDWIDMATAPYSYTTVYMAIALVSNAAEASVTISDSTKVVFGAGETDVLKVLVIGV